jgi:hypothetical protein
MVYNPDPPYEILQTSVLDFTTLQSLKRFARIWDLTANSGNFSETTRTLLATDPSAFRAFQRWSHWLFARLGRTDAIALTRLVELLYQYLTAEQGQDPEAVAMTLLRDYQRTGRSDVPKALRDTVAPAASRGRSRTGRLGKRQQRHLAIERGPGPLPDSGSPAPGSDDPRLAS